MTRRGMGWTLLTAALALPNCGTEGAGARTEHVVEDSTGVSAFELLRTEPFRDGGAEARATRESLTRVALRLADLQADSLEDNAHNGALDPDLEDGGWDFDVTPEQGSHSATASPDNTYGATGLGVWSALRSGTERPRCFATLLDSSLGMAQNAQVDSPPDFLYLVLLAEMFENPELSALARRRYDARLLVDGGAQGLANRVRELRHTSGLDGLIAYDISWLMLSAAALDSAFPDGGYAADAQVFAAVVTSDVSSPAPYFDVSDAHERFYVSGLAWSLVALSFQASDPPTLQRVRALLLAQQAANGAFALNADFPDPNLQATAHAVQALELSGRGHARSLAAATRGARWLRLQQQPNGGWQPSVGRENTLLDADIALALLLSRTRGGEQQIVPEPDVAEAVAPLASPSFKHSPPLAFPLDL